MIISHKHKLIFIKPLKVAGTSFELALRNYCGPEDIITMCTPEDERVSLKRNKIHFQNENNGAKYFDHVIGLDVDFHVSGNVMNNDCYQGMGTILRVFEANSQRYYNHIEARKIKKRIGEDIFNSYTKVSIIRHPIDYLISNYYFFGIDLQNVSFRNYAIQAPVKDFKKFYEINGEYIIDHMIRFENLNEDIKKLEQKIPGLVGLAERMKTFKSKIKRVDDKDKIPGAKQRLNSATVDYMKTKFPKACQIAMEKYSEYCKKFNYK